MNRNEDYLDNLLTSVTNKLDQFDDDYEQSRESLKESYRTQSDLPPKTQSALDEIREENFLRDFDTDLGIGSEEDFIKEFEQELDHEAESVYQQPETDDFVDQMSQLMEDEAEELPLEVDEASQPEISQDTSGQDNLLFDVDTDLDSILNDDSLSETDAAPMEDPLADLAEETVDLSVAEEPEPVIPEPMEPEAVQESSDVPTGMEGLEDIFADADRLLRDDPDGIPVGPEPESVPQASAPQAERPISGEEDKSLEDILGESDDEALSDIGRMLNVDENGELLEQTANDGDPFSAGPDFVFQENSDKEETKKGKKKREPNPNSIFAKLGRLLFGTPEELNPDAVPENGSLEGISDENMEIMAKEDAEAAKKEKKQQKELKKQQKKEAAEKKKQEKEAAKAEKAAKKEKKPKKEKPPKEKKKVPKEPPLPKVPVMMMWCIALSIMVLVFLGTMLVGYTSNVGQSQEAFDSGDYVTAYTKLRGLRIREADENLYHGAMALAGIQTELDAYTALMEQKQYELALDALIRGIGRCHVHSAEAEEWGVSEQLQEMESQLNTLLREQFAVSKRRARKLYNLKKRQDYTLEVHKILEELGLYQSAGA